MPRSTLYPEYVRDEGPRHRTLFELILLQNHAKLEKIEKQQAHERYMRLQEQGKTEQARKDLGNIIELFEVFGGRVEEEIHELFLSFAEAGANVVRLKGGDPLVFGWSGEEMNFLQQKGIQVKVIPGITAASGISAELGIPLTHRGVANSVRFLTGHLRKEGTDPLFVAENAADPDSTLVVYMGLPTLPSLASKLIHYGLPDDTPAIAVERETTPQMMENY
ncbi:Siroheme synthase [Capsicum baccatum]|uniref:uroporphyrinogen-III C-methyltransferase n=1 Tax=Capsicum baccatum TaxID=33114 RepID=A0A2G2VGS4_CAPBA|nr:Siroheme synthase [Capsicum baccatum]